MAIFSIVKKPNRKKHIEIPNNISITYLGNPPSKTRNRIRLKTPKVSNALTAVKLPSAKRSNKVVLSCCFKTFKFSRKFRINFQ